MVEDNPRIELVIITYNTPDLVKECIGTLLQTPYPNFHITVVDNCSYDETWQLVRQGCYIYMDKMEALQTHINKGYGGACNVAARQWKDEVDYYVFMNSDVLPIVGEEGKFQDWLTPLIQTFEDEEHVGIVAPKLIRPPVPDPNWLSNTVVGHAVLGTNAENDEKWYWNKPDGVEFDKQLDAVTLSGACIMIPHDLFWTLGGFVEVDDYITWENGYFHYDEEKDLIYNSRKEGYRAICQPKSKLYHLHKASQSNERLLGVYRYYSDTYFDKKWKEFLKNKTNFTYGGVEE